MRGWFPALLSVWCPPGWGARAKINEGFEPALKAPQGHALWDFAVPPMLRGSMWTNGQCLRSLEVIPHVPIAQFIINLMAQAMGPPLPLPFHREVSDCVQVMCRRHPTVLGAALEAAASGPR